MLVALPELGHGHKAACPRCGATLTTEWDAPRQRPTAYALAALFMLLLSNLFPFISMKVGGMVSQVELLEIPGVMFSEDYASLGTFFLLFVQIVPAFCLVVILLLVNRVRMPTALKIKLARILFQLKSWGMAEIFLAGILVSFVKLMAYGDWQQLYSVVSVLRAATARFPVRGPTLDLGRYCPGTDALADGKGGRTGYPSGAALLLLLHRRAARGCRGVSPL